MKNKQRRRLWLVMVLSVLALIVPGQSLLAIVSTINEKAPSISLGGTTDPLMDFYFEKSGEVEMRTPKIKFKIPYDSPFFQDTKLTVHVRSYYFDQQFEDQSRSLAWAAGGWLGYESGYLKNLFSLGATLYTSQKLLGKENQDGTELLKPGQKSYTVLGKFYGRFKMGRQYLTLYQQGVEVPFLNGNDNRMTPNTFEGAVADGQMSHSQSSNRIRYIAGFIDKMKERDSEEFVSMSRVANPDSAKKNGLLMAGFAVHMSTPFYYGAIFHSVKNTINMGYGAVDFTWDSEDSVDWRLNMQYLDQHSDGTHELTGSFFQTNSWGGRLAGKKGHGTIWTAFSTVDQEAKIRSPYGSYPTHLDLMQHKFIRADEDSWLVGGSYEFPRVAKGNLNLSTDYAEGRNARDEFTGLPLPDYFEWDVKADYHIEDGLLMGTQFLFRASLLKIENESRDRKNFRLVLNYPLPFQKAE